MSKRAAVLLSLIMVGCCKPVNVGQVVDKNHHPAWVQLTLVGKVMVHVHHPEYWTVTLSDGSDQSSCRLSEQEYGAVEVGAHYRCASRHD